MQIYLTHRRDPSRYYDKMDFGLKPIEKLSNILPLFTELEPHHQMQFYVLLRIYQLFLRVGGVLTHLQSLQSLYSNCSDSRKKIYGEL